MLSTVYGFYIKHFMEHLEFDITSGRAPHTDVIFPMHYSRMYSGYSLQNKSDVFFSSWRDVNR